MPRTFTLPAPDEDKLLPTWQDMSDLDKGAALLHVWKRDWEGATYAVENYPCRYLEHPALVALTPAQASEHADQVTGGDEAISERLGQAEYQRLYDLALSAESRHH